MPGLLSGVLPYLYSQSDRLKRNVNGLLSDPMGTMQQTAGGLLDSHRGQTNLLAQAFADPSQPFRVTDAGAMQQAATNMLAGPLGFAPVGMIDAKALQAALGQHTARLQAEADDWAGRKYKPNKGRVFFEGDGPTKGESLSIGGINANRRENNVKQRMMQMDALDRVGRVANKNPEVVESEFMEARRLAEQVAARDGLNFDTTFDAILGQRFTGTQEWMSGPGSIGRAIRNVVEPTITQPKPAQAASGGDDWMREMFGQ